MSAHGIAHVIPSLESGGAERMLVNLLAGMERSRWHPTVVSLRDGGAFEKRVEELGIPITSLRMRGPLPGPGTIWRLRRAIQSAGPDLLQGWMYHGNLAALVARATVRRRMPLIWNIRYTPDDLAREKRLTAAVVRWGARLSSHTTRIIYNSRAGAARHTELGYASERGRVIPNGFDTERFAPYPDSRARWRENLQVPPDAVLIGRIGRYHPMKDHATFLRAAARVRAERPTVRFVLAGRDVDGGNTALRELIAQLELGDAVSLMGEVSAVHELTAALDVACSSSAYGEAFPSVVGEAMACAVPCVATDVGDSSWIVGQTGVVVPPSVPEALAAACVTLIDSGVAGRGQLGAAARARVVAEFSLNQIANRYDETYSEVLAGMPLSR